MPNQSDQNQSNTTPVIPDFQSDVPPVPTDTSNTSTSPQPVAPAQPEPEAPTEMGSSTPPETPPVISTTPKKKFGGGKIIATILGFLILTGGIAGGVILTQQQQDIRERAGTCVDVDCAIVLDPVGNYHYDESQDDNEDEDLDGETNDDGDGNDGLSDFEYFDQVLDVETGPGTGGDGDSCTNDTWCANGYTCVSGACQGNPITTTCGRDQDPGAPVCCTGSCGGSVVCEEGKRLECNTGGVHCTIDADSADCGGANPPDVPPGDTPTPTPPVAMCQEVRAYKPTLETQFTALELTQLEVGDSVRFCVSGGPNASEFDKARFTINGTLQTETTTPTVSGILPFIGFCQTYTIPANTTIFNISAEIHHPTLGWK